MSKNFSEGKHIDLLLIGEGEEKHYVLNKDFYMYDRPLHNGGKHFCCYCLQAFRTTETLKCQVKYYFKIKVIRGLRCHQMVNTLDSKIMTEK